MDNDVDDNILLDAIKMGTKAPSAHNRQPWKFKILSCEEKNQIASILYEKTKDIVGHTGPHTAGIIKDVPKIIVVFIDNQNKDDRDMDIISIGACIENIILYLTDIGLGTLWIANTNIIRDDIKRILNVSYETVSCIGVGYKNQEPHERPRKDFSEVLITEEVVNE